MTVVGATSDAILERLVGLHPKLIDLSLGRMEGLLDLLNHPEWSLPPTIHIAGTNGKGSTQAFLAAMLGAAGLSVHTYTSPHLVDFHERIRLHGRAIDETALSDLLAECERVNEGMPITFFEITTAAAFVAFAQDPADVLILETGLGGRLDATNVIKKPKVTVITPVSMDHQQFLGDTLADIAWEKAGIIKPGLPCVVARQAPQAMAAIRTRAEELRAALYVQDVDWSVRADGERLIYEGATGRRELPLPGLAGAHQIGNAGTALAALERFRQVPLTDPGVASGLRNVAWPGRLQRLTDGPLVSRLPDGWELWLDGGHNAAAGQTIAAHAAAHWHDRPLHLICGMLNSKETGEFLKPLADQAAGLHGVAIPGEANSLSAEAIAATAGALDFDANAATDVTAAIDAIAGKGPGPGPGRVLICGSLYLAGRVLAAQGEDARLGTTEGEDR